MKDVMAALKALAESEASITDLTSTRIFVNRIPRNVLEGEDTFHPQKMLVLRQGGGSGKRDYLPLDKPTVTVLCYGESDYEADRVRRAVWERFDDLKRETFSDVLIHHITPVGGALPLVDGDIVWPAISQSFSVLADVKET